MNLKTKKSINFFKKYIQSVDKLNKTVPMSNGNPPLQLYLKNLK